MGIHASNVRLLAIFRNGLENSVKIKKDSRETVLWIDKAFVLFFDEFNRFIIRFRHEFYDINPCWNIGNIDIENRSRGNHMATAFAEHHSIKITL
jgi:hypothetical protein